MKAAAAACSLALFLAGCGNELLTAPPETATLADTAARVYVTPSSVTASGSKTVAAGAFYTTDSGLLLQIDAMGLGDADLASIEVIKGASAARVYGSRGCTASISVVTKVKAPGAAR